MPSAQGFTSELHILCEEAKWGQLKRVVTAVIDGEQHQQQDEEDDFDYCDWTTDHLKQELRKKEGPYEWTPLMLSCVRAPLDLLALLVRTEPAACLIPDKSGSLPLHFLSCWRRGPFVHVLLKVMVESAPAALEVQNAWGQTPLHSMLDSKQLAPLGCLRIFTDQGSHSDAALSTPDRQGRVPLHVAAEKNVPSEYLQIMVETYREAALEPNNDGDLPCHVLHNVGSGVVPTESMEALLIALALGSARRRRSVGQTVVPTNLQQLRSLTSQAEASHGDSRSLPATPELTKGQIACRCMGSTQSLLPIHLAAHYGVKLEIMKGICRQYPLGVGTIVQWPLEIEDYRSDDMLEEDDEEDGEDEEESDELPEQAQRVAESNLLKKELVSSRDAHPSTRNEDEGCDEMVMGVAKRSDDGSRTPPRHLGRRLSSRVASPGLDSQMVDRQTSPQEDEPWEEESLQTGQTESEILGAVEEAGSETEEPWEEESLNSVDESSDDLDEYEDAATEMEEEPTKEMCALEIFECGRAAQECETTKRTQNAGRSQQAMTYFVRRSDLLLAYAANVVNSETGQRYLDEAERLRRLERLIRKEAREVGGGQPMSDTTIRLWMYLASYNAKDDPRKYIRSVGRILNNLPPSGLWKLTLVPVVHEEKYIEIKCTGRSVVAEAELRAPTARMDAALRHFWFQYLLTAFLEPLDALNFSVTCRTTRAMGVRLLPQVPLRVTEGSWTKAPDAAVESPPKPWQRLDVLVTPDCSHTVFVSFYVECKHAEGSDDTDHHAFGGMMVVRDDNRRLRPNPIEPWGSAVVACCDVPPVSGSLVRLSFAHVPGRTYGLWHYSRGEPGSSLYVSDVRVRQLLHSCDRRGRSPLHMLLSSSVNQGSNPRLNLHVSMLLAAKFGTGDSVGDVPLHYALKCGVNEDVLQAIITASPAALVETDKEGRTPMHAAFLLSKEEPPALGAIRALLTPPGENAIKLKDSSGRLPIHIAAERGAGEAVLRQLVDTYIDGCYRTNKDGDLPVHLLMKSGAATRESIELLIQPIMHNESICRIGGNQGNNLPLHIACENRCSFRILEKLLQTYRDAACVARVRYDTEEAEYPLDIFEKTKKQDDEESSLDRLAKREVMDADFSLRSDLIFVYNPFIVKSDTGRPYRNDRERIRRIENVIRREAIRCGEDRKINRRANLSDMAAQGWIFLCTYSNPDDPADNFAGTVRRILRGLQPSAVNVLAHVENPKSLPIPDQYIRDCATSVCKLLIMSRLRFVGRYVLFDEIHPVHKSESCLVMRAKDYGMEDMYRDFMEIYKAKEEQVQDDISDAGSEPPVPPDPNRPHSVTMGMFLEFAKALGVDVKTSRREILQLAELDKEKAAQPLQDGMSDDEGQLVNSRSGRLDLDDDDDIEIGKEAFVTFCRAHRLTENGIRTVVIKFMKSINQFRREIDVRQDLNLSGPKWPVVPIFEDYNVDRIEKSRKRDIDTISMRDDVAEDAISGAPENKDELYALDIQEKNASAHNFALYKYAVVLPAGDRDLGEISQHEELGILQVRDYMMQVGTALKKLHDKSLIHGDLKMENVVRFGRNLALIDFDGAMSFGRNGSGDKMGGSSSKFCTGVLPPEMFTRIDLFADYPQLTKYEDYWRQVSEDAKDLKLLTPDDIQTISSVIKSLLAKADIARNLAKASSPTKGLRAEMDDAIGWGDHDDWKEEIYSGLEDKNDWKDILSMALITISFEDLPFSLSRCKGVYEFSQVWSRLLFHSKLWTKIKPHISEDEQYAYIVKTYNDMPDEFGIIEKPMRDEIPYTLLGPSESLDVWGFGVLLFALCSGGQLFHVGYDGDLHDTADFEKLHGWNKRSAERLIQEKIEDPLAQDLLRQILVPSSERLGSMETVLAHPFFGPSSNLDAQRILEKHEEQQLIVEETVVIKRMTAETKRKMERSMERQCKAIFDEEKIVVPTCLMVFPYCLEFENDYLIVDGEVNMKLVEKVGLHLLEINKATARLSFWLMMKRSMSNSGKSENQTFKTKIKAWQKRSKSESSNDVVKEVLSEIGCGSEYTGICKEVLAEGKNSQTSKDFLKDPMTTARTAISESTESLLQCYESAQWLYLVDEINGVPVQSDNLEDAFEDVEQIYPIKVDRSKNLIENLFLPFMTVVVMKVTSEGNLEALAKLLGVPSPYRVPDSWRDCAAGLVHKDDKPSSIAEFAVLQEVLRRQERAASKSSASQGSRMSMELAQQSGDEMKRLEDFFREFDPVRTFSDLHRVSDGKESSPAFWTTEAEVARIQGEFELASAEHRLRELKKEWLKKQEIQQEIIKLHATVERLRSPEKPPQALRPAPEQSVSPTATTTTATQQNGPSRAASTLPPVGTGNRKTDVNGTANKKKRKKMRFRPFFGVC